MSDVKFLRGTKTAYTALKTKDDKTFYYLTDTDQLYVGAHELTNKDLDVADIALAAKSDGVVTIKGLKEVDGKIQVSDDSSLDVVFAKVAITGKAEDISVEDAGNHFTATNVEAVLAEIADHLGKGVDSKTVYVVEATGTAGDAFSKRYSLYQGAKGTTSSPVAGEKLVDIDLPKDMVVSDGVCRKATAADVSDAGSDPGFSINDYIIVLTIANNNGTKIYIPINDLVDIYTAQASATQIQLTIDNNNEISAVIVDGAVNASKLATDAVETAKIKDNAVTTAKIADDAVTADKVAIAAHTESQDRSADPATGTDDGLSISVTTTDGQVSNVTGSIRANTYDAYGAATAAVNALDTVADVVVASESSDIITLTGSIKEVDGIISKGTNTNIQLKKIAKTGKAIDAALETATAEKFAPNEGTSTVTNVDSAIAALAGALTWGSI